MEARHDNNWGLEQSVIVTYGVRSLVQVKAA
jgi:hypothetical protein